MNRLLFPLGILLICLGILGQTRVALGQGRVPGIKPPPRTQPPQTAGMPHRPSTARPWYATSGESVAEDLRNSAASMERARKLDSIEPLVERTMRLHPNDWEVLFQGARIYAELENSGYWINGQFRRGTHGDVQKGARRVYSHRRDHTRALQLLDRAIRIASGGGSPEKLASFYWDAAHILTSRKAYVGLYQKTDLSRLPTLEFQAPTVNEREPVPVDAEGNPIFFEVPESWTSAKNDGERLLWLLQRARLLNDDYAAEAEFIHAKYLLKEYLGVQTVTGSPGYDPRTKAFDGDEASLQVIAGVHELGVEESMAYLEPGIRRFAVPDKHNFVQRFIKLAREPGYASHASLALEELAEIFENRRQYAVAARYWSEAATRFGGGAIDWERDRLNQITKAWGVFEDARPVQAGEKATLGYWYRNGKSVDLTAYRIDVSELVGDILEYLRSDPFPVDPDRISVSKLGMHLVTEDRDKYLKEEVAQWTKKLEPLPNHWENRVELPLPFDQPGAYLVEGVNEDGNASSIIVWINDMTILRRPLENGLFYYVADKRNGTPVGWAKFSFIGFRLESLGNGVDAPLDAHGQEVPLAFRRQYKVVTNEITKWADAKGQLTLDDSVLSPNFRWFLLTTAPGNRAAILGFSDLRPTGSEPPLEALGIRHFTVTDRPAYLPGQDCRFTGWLRQKMPHEDEQSYRNPGVRSVTVKLESLSGELLDEAVLESSVEGNFNGSFPLPHDLSPGTYQLQTLCQGSMGKVAVQVHPPQVLQARLHLKAGLKQVTRGAPATVEIRAETHEGEALGFEKVAYEVYQRPHQPKSISPQPHAWLYGEGYGDVSASYPWYPGWRQWGWDSTATLSKSQKLIVEQGQIRLDGDGLATVTIKTGESSTSEGQSTQPVAEDYEINAWIVGEAAQAAEAQESLVVTEQPFKVYAKMDRSFVRVGESAIFEAWCYDYEGTPISGTGEVKIYEIDFTGPEPTETLRFTRKLDPDEKGYVRKELGAHDPGSFRVSYSLTDADGNAVEGATVTFVTGDEYKGENARFNALEMVTDKPVYKPGEKVELRLNTEASGQSVALFVRPRNGVFGSAEVIRLVDKSTPYHVFVKSDDSPSFFVEAILLSDGEFQIHTKEIVVAPPEEELRIGLALKESEIQPGKEVTVDVSVTDRQGLPVEGNVRLALVPDSDAFKRESDIRDVFWNERVPYKPMVEHELKTRFQSFSRPATSFMRPIGIFGALRFSDAAEEDEAQFLEEIDEEPVAQPITYGDLALSLPVVWQAVPLNESGVGEATLVIPKVAGKWRMQAWAIDGQTRVGYTEKLLESVERWRLDVKSPRWFVEGDRAIITATIWNTDEAELKMPVSLQVDGATLALAEGTMAEAALAIPPGEKTILSWEIEALTPDSAALVKLQLGEGEEMETLSRLVAIHSRRQPTRRWWNASLNQEAQGTNFKFTVPELSSSDRVTLEVQAGGNGLGAMLSVMESWSLEPNPQTTAEEVAYQLAPAVAFHGFIKSLSEENRKLLIEQDSATARWLDDAGLTDSVARLVDQLSELTCADRGWSWFAEEEASPLATATVVRALHRTSQAGFPVPKALLKEGLTKLKAFQKVSLAKLSKSKGARTEVVDALVDLTLISTGSSSSAMRKRLFRDWRKHDHFTKTLIANALHLRGTVEDRNTIRFFLGEKLRKDEATGHVNLDPENKDSYGLWHGSSTELQAQYLKFLIRVKGDSPVTDAVAAYLLGHRKQPNVWNSTRDSAFAIEALIDYLELKASKGTLSAGMEQTLALQLDGQPHLSATFAEGALAPRHRFVVGDLKQGEHQVRLEGSAGQSVQLFARLTIDRLPDLMTEKGSDLKVRRSYQVVDGAKLAVGESVDSDSIVEVALEISAARPVDFVRLTERLPAGFELVDQEIKHPEATVSVKGQGEIFVAFPALTDKQTIRYKIRPTIPGRFHALPATINADHHPQLKGQSDEMIFTVRPSTPEAPVETPGEVGA